MESKYTRAQIEEKLDTVFDSVLQTKDVEVTGDMEITPDEGFLGLKKVTINANVQGGSSGGGSPLEYLKVELSKNDTHEGWSNLLTFNPCLIKAEIGGGYGLQIGTFGFIQQYAEEYSLSIKAIMLNVDAVITVPDIGTLNFEQVLEAIGMTEAIATLPRITKEEFYTI